MPHTDTLRSAYAAFKAGDLPRVFAALDDQIEWHVPSVLPHGGDYHGHDGVMAFFGALASAFDAPTVDVEAVLEQGDRVVVLGRSSGGYAGGQVSYPFAHAWTFSGDRAIRFDEYVDPAELLARV